MRLIAARDPSPGSPRALVLSRLLTLLGGLLWAACSDSGGDGDQCPVVGAAGCPCTPEGLCLGDLTCVAGLCASTPGGSSPATTTDDTDAAPTASEPSGATVPEPTTTTDDPPTTNDPTADDCPGAQALCDAVCVDLDADPAHCGGCGQPCAPGDVCDGGQCITIDDCTQDPCIGLTYCDEATRKCLPGCAFNPQCEAGEYCDTATHTCACTTGFNLCNGTCTPESSPTACGASCTVCQAPANGEAFCADGECDFECLGAYFRCGDQCFHYEEPVCLNDDNPNCEACPLGPHATNVYCGWNGSQDDCQAECEDGYEACGGECKLPEWSDCTKDSDCCVAHGYVCYQNSFCGPP